MENYLHEFMRIFFANRRLIKRFFLIFSAVVLLLPLLLKQSFDITAEVIVQSKKLSQSDSASSLTAETDKFVPTSLADMETEANILRSTTLVRQTILGLSEEGRFSMPESLLKKIVLKPFKNYVTTPLREHVTNPLRGLLGLETDSVRDTHIDEALQAIQKKLQVETLPGSNIISVVLSTSDPAQGTVFVERLLHNYLQSRQNLQSNNLPEEFYEQKKQHYRNRIDALEHTRQQILEGANASHPAEEITFRLNAVNTEEQSLNQYRDRLLESRAWLDYLNKSLVEARKIGQKEYAFPFTFKQLIGGIAYEDRELKDVGERLVEQIMGLDNALISFTAASQPVIEHRKRLANTHHQFLRLVENRIAERSQEKDILESTIQQKIRRINELKSQIKVLQAIQSRLRQLDTEIDALHKAFSAYTQRYEESLGQNQLDAVLSNARILSYPYEPTEEAFPRPLVMIPLGLLTGLLLAIALGYIKEFFDHTFKIPAQVMEQLGVPILLVIDCGQEETHKPNKPRTLAWFWHWIKK